MMESHLQFDLIEPEQEWERYNLVIIPDEMMPDGQTVDRLHRYIDKGGSVMISHNGGIQAGTNNSWLEKYGIFYNGASSFKPAYLVVDDNFIKDMPGYAYAFYEGASEWEVKLPAKSLVKLGEPLFQRSASHYTSHKHTPFNHITKYSAVAISGKIGLTGFPLGISYYNNGYWVYREMFEKLVREILPIRLIETNTPLTSEVTVTHQPANKEIQRQDRYLVHIINWSSTRKTPQHPETHDCPVPLSNIWIKLNIPIRQVNVKTVVTPGQLSYQFTETGVEVIVPQIIIHEIVCFELLNIF
jgi:hypothetical protein